MGGLLRVSRARDGGGGAGRGGGAFPPPLWGRVREGGSHGKGPNSWHPSPCPSPTRGEGMRETWPPHSSAPPQPSIPKYKTTRRGGIPSGSLEVLGGLTKPYVSF